MQGSADIEKKIHAFYDIEDIVSAMKAYAGVTIRKTEEIVPHVREYEKNMLSAMGDVMAHFPDMLLPGKNGGKRILVAFGSSQGLCGAFNEKMAEAAADIMTAHDVLLIIGKKLRASIELKHIPYKGWSDSVMSVNGIKSALRDTVSTITGIYRSHEVYTLTLLFTSIADKKATIEVEQILPPDPASLMSQESAGRPFAYLDAEVIFKRALEEFLYISLYRCYMESLRSENWYRLRSMEGASDTIKKYIGELSSSQKYIRQEEITEEMLEILGSGLFYR